METKLRRQIQSNTDLILVICKFSQQLHIPVCETSKTLFGRQFAVEGLNAGGCSGRGGGSDRKAAENLSVLFLDRSSGLWYRWVLEWCQDSDLKNSSGFRGPEVPLYRKRDASRCRQRSGRSSRCLLWTSSTAGSWQWTQTSSLATHDLLEFTSLQQIRK